jgi:carbon-monoxide dehydrogenase medium subunit
MRDFDFLEPATVQEASRMLTDLGDDCRVMAGGTALMLAMRQRMVSPSHIVSLGRLDALKGIDFDPVNGLRVGALCRHADVAQSPAVRQHYPMLASMAGQVANPQVRNQGTLGGNLCYADPSTDPPGCLLALDARVVLSGTQGERELPMQDFLVDYFTTALQGDEVLTAVRVPPPVAGASGLYTRFLRTAADHRPLANLSLVVQKQGLHCQSARLVVGAAVPVAGRLLRAEALLAGQSVTLELAAQVADAVAQDIDPMADLRGSAEYRRDMVRVITCRAVANLFNLPDH